VHYDNLDLDALRTFAVIAEVGGFTAAGARLGRTQSAISVKIRRLEESLGRRVFARTSRSLSLTPDGQTLLPYARRLLELNDETLQRFAGPEAAGSLRLGCAEYFVPHHLPEVLARFSRLYPRVQIEVKVGMSGPLVEALERGQLDLVIAKRDGEAEVGRILRQEKLHWVAAPGFVLSETEPLPFCAMPPPCLFRDRGLKALKAMGRPMRIVYTSESVSGVVAAVRAGIGIAVISDGSMVSDLTILGRAEGFPKLGQVDLTLFGEDAPDDTRGAKAAREPQRRQSRRQAKAALVQFIEETLRQIPVRRAA
jgi:DNA-binding transcriptional LysR family regulator